MSFESRCCTILATFQKYFLRENQCKIYWRNICRILFCNANFLLLNFAPLYFFPQSYFIFVPQGCFAIPIVLDVQPLLNRFKLSRIQYTKHFFSFLFFFFFPINISYPNIHFLPVGDKHGVSILRLSSGGNPCLRSRTTIYCSTWPLSRK